MALKTYREKRNFNTTPEPRGRRTRRKGDSFVIQKHAARRLHYDLRLEMDGVLKSWAVTRGPSLVPGEKRLAVHVEDHPLDYGDFEGTIPKGEYGGGTVIVWDRGTWRPVFDAHKGYAKGHLEFELDGEKLHGRWHLVRIKAKAGEKRENWLLIKGEDATARSQGDADILEEMPLSVRTGRDISEVAGEFPGWSSKTGRIDNAVAKASAAKRVASKKGTSSKAAFTKAGNGRLPRNAKVNPRNAPSPASAMKGARKAAMPDFIEPTLATLVANPPDGPRWIHEIKFDGYRLQARIEDGHVRLLTRSGLDWTEKFGAQVPQTLTALPVTDAILDGELVVENDAGASDFSSLQADLSEGRDDRFVFYAFDLLYLDGHDLTRVGLADRKERLASLVPKEGGALRYSSHFEDGGDLVLRHACRLSLEGVVSKLRDAPYRSGRGKSWVKSKCSARQEFVVAGYVPSTVSGSAIGSLVLGLYENGGLRHVGRVGTGFSAKVAQDLMLILRQMKVTSSPFAEKIAAVGTRGVTFVRPELVAEVEFRAWTGDGHLRHASFRGLREDKPAAEIVREAAPNAKPPAAPKRTVQLTHPDRIYWPDAGVTKEGLANYYVQVWRHIAPHVVGRPLALLRCPNGINGQSFFQKHAWKGMSKHIVEVRDPGNPEGQPMLSIRDVDGLMALVQSAALEIHPWGSTIANWDQPDTIIMDLDPGDGVTWQHVIDGALEVRQRLTDAGLTPFVKTSGGKGLHVVAPLKPKANWPAVKAFTKAIAEAMAGDDPARYVATISKAKRKGRILVDYLRNQRGATAVAAYSSRARPGAAVSAPLSWEELTPAIGPAHFTVENMPARLASFASDPWEGFRGAATPLQIAGRRAAK